MSKERTGQRHKNKIYFKDQDLDLYLQAFPLNFQTYGGAAAGEAFYAASRVNEKNLESWVHEWGALAARLEAEGATALRKGHRVSAREAYLRSYTYYRTATLCLRVADPRFRNTLQTMRSCFRRAAGLFEPPIEPIEIPYEGTTLPGYFYRVDDSGQPRPTLIATNGYDATVQGMHFGHAAAAVRRGYNCLIFDGPGQGRVLYKQGIHMRSDWENVVTPVVDYALSRPEVDPQRVALIGWSFGGYLAPRAASGEHRLAACIADPGQWDMLEAMKGFFSSLPKEALEDLPHIDPSLLEPIMEYIMSDASLRWSVVQRAFWVHGIDSLADYLRIAKDYELSSVVDKIRCPTLVTQAENDPVSRFAGRLYDALTCPKELLRFTEAEGAGDHCEAMARSLFHQKSFDWLDETLGAGAS